MSLEAPKDRMNRLLSEIFEQTIREVLGELPARTLMRRLALTKDLDFHSISTNPEAFAEALRKIVGRSSNVLLRIIVKKASRKIGISAPEDLDFHASVRRIRRHILAETRTSISEIMIRNIWRRVSPVILQRFPSVFEIPPEKPVARVLQESALRQ